MFRKKVTTMIAAVAVLSLVGGTVCVAAENGEAEYTAAENVYATLASDGSFEHSYVIHSFDVEKAGQITSYGEYDSVKNLTSLNLIQTKGGVQTVDAEEGKFYYQGDSGKIKLPWQIDIAYYLDGQKIEPGELAGKSGALEIVVNTTKEPSVNEAFYENYMLQTTFTFNMEKCKNIDAEGASVAEAGSNKTVIFTSLPGKDAKMRIKADVEEFEMDAATIAAVPFSMAFEMPDTDEMADGLTQLADAIQQLDEGVGELVSGMNLLSDNAGTLKSGAGSFALGINTVSDNSETLVNASAQINGALQTIVSNLGNVDMSSMAELAGLPGALTDLAGALEGMKSGLEGIPAMYRQAYGALSDSVEGVSGAALTDAELAALEAAVQNDETAKAVLQRVKALNALARQLAQAQTAVDSVDAVVGELSKTIGDLAQGLRAQAGQLSDKLTSQDLAGALGKLQSGLGTLADNYSDFHSGLTAYTGGVDMLADSYGQLNQGLSAYLSGVEQAAEGTGVLKQGTSQLAVNTENIPEEMQTQIEEFMANYQYDFTPVSFIDERNESVTSVQFIISTEKIEIPEPVVEEELEEERSGFIDRLKGIFGGDK